MINRRNAIKVMLLVFSAIVSFLLIERWFRLISAPDLSVLNKKKTLIAEIAELIIPRTDTPGAKDAKVEDFIVGMVEFCSDRKTQNNFISGLQQLENHALSEYNKPFISCSNSAQLRMLSYFEKNAFYQVTLLNKIRNKLMGKPFIIKFKELTVEGYCTSQQGATRGLAYDYIPVAYEACIPLKSHQRAWATK